MRASVPIASMAIGLQPGLQRTRELAPVRQAALVGGIVFPDRDRCGRGSGLACARSAAGRVRLRMQADQCRHLTLFPGREHEQHAAYQRHCQAADQPWPGCGRAIAWVSSAAHSIDRSVGDRLACAAFRCRDVARRCGVVIWHRSKAGRRVCPAARWCTRRRANLILHMRSGAAACRGCFAPRAIGDSYPATTMLTTARCGFAGHARFPRLAGTADAFMPPRQRPIHADGHVLRLELPP